MAGGMGLDEDEENSCSSSPICEESLLMDPAWLRSLVRRLETNLGLLL